MTQGARKRAARRAREAVVALLDGKEADPAKLKMLRDIYRIGVRLCPCMLCHGEIGVARCNARHGTGKPCPFCEPCGTRPKKNKTKWRPCDGSGVHFKGQQRLTEEELKPNPEIFPFSWDV